MLKRTPLSKDKRRSKQKSGFSFDAANSHAFKVFKLNQEPFEKSAKLVRGDSFPLRPVIKGRSTPKSLEGVTFPA